MTMDDFKKLKDHLLTQLQVWRSVIEHPRLYIDKVFSGLRNQIDFFTETALQSLDNHESAQSQEEAYNKLNSIREVLIQELANHEKQLMNNATILVSGETWKKSRESFVRIGQKIASVFCDDQSEWIDYEVQYARIAQQIIQQIFKLQEQAMSKQTFMFFYSETNWGVLIHLQDTFLNMIDLHCFR